MCGIAVASGFRRDTAIGAVTAMCSQMHRRGPDDSGIEFVGTGAIPTVLGNRRLAIIDPSPAGHQPMQDSDRGTWITFNGMIYNFRELRTQLVESGERFSSHTDTEVVLRAYGRYGVDCVRHLRGMYAFAIRDPRDDSLFLARDPLGIKPLYYATVGTDLLVASSVKALLASGLVETRLSRDGIESFLAFGAVSEPMTAIDGIRALEAGHTGVYRGGRLAITRWWTPPTPTVPSESGNPASEIRARVEEAVRSHLVSDAPIGVFLSGGVDSSVIAAVACRMTNRVRTVSVVFDDARLSEKAYIDSVVQRLDVEHSAVELDGTMARSWLSDAFAGMDQPSFDGLNTYAVSRIAHEAGLKVALSGLGGDELFDGYGQARRIRTLHRIVRLPRQAHMLAAALALAGGSSARRAKLQAWADGSVTSPYELLRRLFLPDEVRMLLGSEGGGRLPAVELASTDELYCLSMLELSIYMRNVLLRDTDAMSMTNSIEVRVPFLDQGLVEHVLGTPARVRGNGKRLLSQAFSEEIPPEVRRRPKRGFALPLASWMRGDLTQEVESMLSDPPAALSGVIDPTVALDVWKDFCAGERGWHQPWALFALGSWTESLLSLTRASEVVR